MPFNPLTTSPIVMDRPDVDFDKDDGAILVKSRVRPVPGKGTVWLPDTQQGAPPRSNAIWAPVVEPSETISRGPLAGAQDESGPTLDEIDDLISAWINNDESILSRYYDTSPSQLSHDTTPTSEYISFASTPFTTPPEEFWIRDISLWDERGDSPNSGFFSIPSPASSDDSPSTLDIWPSDASDDPNDPNLLFYLISSSAPPDSLLVGLPSHFRPRPSPSLIELSPLSNQFSLPLVSFPPATVDPTTIFSTDDGRASSFCTGDSRVIHPDDHPDGLDTALLPSKSDDPRGHGFQTAEDDNHRLRSDDNASPTVSPRVSLAQAARTITASKDELRWSRDPPLDDVCYSTPPPVSMLLTGDHHASLHTQESSTQLLSPIPVGASCLETLSLSPCPDTYPDTDEHPSERTSSRKRKPPRSTSHAIRTVPPTSSIPASQPAASKFTDTRTNNRTSLVDNRGVVDSPTTPTDAVWDVPARLFQRRSTRAKRSVSYQETDDEVEAPVPKRAKANAASRVEAKFTRRSRSKVNKIMFHCPFLFCSGTFSRNNDLIRHLRTVSIHPPPTETEDTVAKTCGQCGVKLSRPDARKRHEDSGACGKRTIKKRPAHPAVGAVADFEVFGTACSS